MSGEKFILAYCGLVCSNCGMYKKSKCQGCHSAKPMNRHCSMKKCAGGRGFATCADCRDFTNLKECKKLNNLISKFFGLVFRSDRIGNLNQIREVGLEKFKEEKLMSGEK